MFLLLKGQVRCCAVATSGKGTAHFCAGCGCCKGAAHNAVTKPGKGTAHCCANCCGCFGGAAHSAVAKCGKVAVEGAVHAAVA